MSSATIATIKKLLKELHNYNPSSDPATKQVKSLGIIQARVMIEVIYTLERLDESNKKLELSNQRLQKIVVALSVLTAILAAVQVIIPFIK